MTKDEIKTLSNMTWILPKIEIKDIYIEDDCFYIYQLLYGYKQLEKYFENKDVINKLLNKKINNISLFDLIRIVRNRYSHIEKHDKINEYIILLTELKKNDINTLKTEIENGINEIFIRELNGDILKVLVNTKIFITAFELLKNKINKSVDNNIYEEKIREKLKPFINELEFDELDSKSFDENGKKMLMLYKSDDMKNSLTNLYGKSIYEEMIKMVEDDSYDKERINELLSKIIAIENINKNKK